MDCTRPLRGVMKRGTNPLEVRRRLLAILSASTRPVVSTPQRSQSSPKTSKTGVVSRVLSN